MSEATPIVRYPDGTGRSLAQVVALTPAGGVVELAPGHHAGPIVIEQPLTLRGAGDLTLISGGLQGPVVRIATEGVALLDSIRLAEGQAERGGGICVERGQLELVNVHMQRCLAGQGGALFAGDGVVMGVRVRIDEVEAERGGAIHACGRARVLLQDSQIGRVRARQGGLHGVEDEARIDFSAVTVRRAAAVSGGGGQILWVRGRRPSVSWQRVRLEGVLLGQAVAAEDGTEWSWELSDCELPSALRELKGLKDAGGNRWR